MKLLLGWAQQREQKEKGGASPTRTLTSKGAGGTAMLSRLMGVLAAVGAAAM